MKVGAVFCPLNRTQTLNTFVEDIRVTEGRLLLVAPKFADTGRQLLAECVALLVDADNNLTSFAVSIGEASDVLRMTPRENTDLAIVNFTTGTMGSSTGAMLPHGALITSFLGGVHWSGMRASDKVAYPL